jgi:hypothetical protein
MDKTVKIAGLVTLSAIALGGAIWLVDELVKHNHKDDGIGGSDDSSGGSDSAKTPAKQSAPAKQQTQPVNYVTTDSYQMIFDKTIMPSSTDMANWAVSNSDKITNTQYAAAQAYLANPIFGN